MYQSIGINLSKSLDAATKRIKIPAITQRNYYKSNNNYEEEFINFYKSDSTNNDIDYDRLEKIQMRAAEKMAKRPIFLGTKRIDEPLPEGAVPVL